MPPEQLPPEQLRAGRLLVAAPLLRDPNFARTVVLLLEHADDEGTLGIVLTRPSEAPVSALLPAWQSVASTPAVVHVGGPVAPTAAIGLVAVREPDRLPPGAFAAMPSGPVGGLVLGTVDLDIDPGSLPSLVGMRLFAGYAGWSARQLAAEVADGGWYLLDALPSDPFAPVPTLLWADVLRRQGPPLARLAAMPLDPSAN